MKIYNNVIVSVIASTMLSTGVAQAYDGAKKQCGDHPRNGMMQAVKKLDLTKEQRQVIRDIKSDLRDQTKVTHDKKYNIRKALHQEMSSETYNANKVRELENVKSEIVADLTVHRIETMRQIRKELTPAQLKRLDKIKERCLYNKAS